MGAGKPGRGRRMGVDNRADVGAFLVAAQVHFYFAGGAKALRTVDDIKTAVDHPNFVRGDERLAHTRLGGEVAVFTRLDGDIAVVCCNPAFLPKTVADVNYLFFEFFIHFYEPPLGSGLPWTKMDS